MKIDSISIIGGGTAGWLTAAYLSYNLPDLQINLIDKEISTPVGVGEGTLLNFSDFLDSCGFHKEDWFNKIGATYKSGILFKDWVELGKDIWHPFFKGKRNFYQEISIHDLWSVNQDLDFKRYALSMYDVSIDYNSVDYRSLDHYGYHIDCSKLVLYIKEKLKGRINFIDSEVIEIDRKEDLIKEIKLKNGKKLSSDFFVDCTGFRGILNETHIRKDLTNRLFCNTAIAGHIPYADRDLELTPYVISQAVDHGWIWKIPVKNRIGSGLVFDRNITDIEEAKEYFIQHWNYRVSKDRLSVIDWTPYYDEKQWQGNVVSIGLSAGFIEPLESTGISLIMAGISKFYDMITDYQYDNNSRDLFNSQMIVWFEDCIDFVSMHYHKNNRDTKFWKNVKDNIIESDRLIYYKNKLLETNIPIPFNGKFINVFGGSNWSTWMIQMGYPISPRNISIDKEQILKVLKKNYETNERDRHIWSRFHSVEIDRLSRLN